MTEQPPQRGPRKFIRAYLDFRRYRDKHPDLADFYSRRYQAFRIMLGLDLTEPPSRGDGAHERTALHHAFDDLARFYLTISTPFAGYLEAPARLVQIGAPYQARFESLAGEQQELCIDLLCELAEAIYGPCERQIGQDELERLGVGDSQAPDTDDYF